MLAALGPKPVVAPLDGDLMPGGIDAAGREIFLRLFNYWRIIFAVAFAMGVVSGIVMSYQFGTNWSVFSERAPGRALEMASAAEQSTA